MQITEVVVKSGKTVSNPHESYSNLRADIVLKAECPRDGAGHFESWDADAAIPELQMKAEKAVDADLKRRLDRLAAPDRTEAGEKEIALLKAKREKAQAELAELEARYPDLPKEEADREAAEVGPDEHGEPF